MLYAGYPFFLQASSSFTELIAHTGVLAKTILVILLVLSVVSWTIMLEKARFFRSASMASRRFMKSFIEENSLIDLREAASKNELAPEAQVVIAVSSELSERNLNSPEVLDKFLDAVSINIVSDWESYLIFLATTATISPFLGLLGTVWGIMNSFHGIGQRGSASLAVVAPGISEALVATAAGLAVAIPAVIAFNYFMQKIRIIESELQSFSSDFLNIIERDILSSKGNGR